MDVAWRRFGICGRLRTLRTGRDPLLREGSGGCDPGLESGVVPFPAEGDGLLSRGDGTPGGTRTHYLRIRNPTLYPDELRAR